MNIKLNEFLKQYRLQIVIIVAGICAAGIMYVSGCRNGFNDGYNKGKIDGIEAGQRRPCKCISRKK